jgi:hypothetical protein
MKQIELSQGKVALIDDEDFERVSKFKWSALKDCGTWYAVGYTRGSHATRKAMKLHRFILNAPPGVMVDHRNRDGLDNRRENIRFATCSQNTANSLGWSASGYKGVSWHKRHKKWIAHVMKDQRLIHLGYFDDKGEAAQAYNDAARQLFGEFARLNEV